MYDRKFVDGVETVTMPIKAKRVETIEREHEVNVNLDDVAADWQRVLSDRVGASVDDVTFGQVMRAIFFGLIEQTLPDPAAVTQPVAKRSAEHSAQRVAAFKQRMRYRNEMTLAAVQTAVAFGSTAPPAYGGVRRFTDATAAAILADLHSRYGTTPWRLAVTELGDVGPMGAGLTGRSPVVLDVMTWLPKVNLILVDRTKSPHIRQVNPAILDGTYLPPMDV